MSRLRTGKSSVVTRTPQGGSATVTSLRAAGVQPPRATATAQVPHERIARRAHELWVGQGCPHGRDQEHWLEAERQLKAELAGNK
jgi:hypothetical protein